MSNLRDLRKHLKSIENIKKITDAMERVAAARLRKVQAKAEESRPYITKMQEMLKNLTLTEAVHPLFEQRSVKKTGVVVISADRGLSGSYNSNLLHTADQFIKKYTQENVELILLGRKAVEHYRRRPWSVKYQETKWADQLTLETVMKLSNQLVDWFLSGNFDEVWLIYTNFISIMRRKVVIEKFLNIEPPKNTQPATQLNYIFEPSPEEILKTLVPQYCMMRIQSALYEAYASELAARIVAMQMASKNAEELITRLTLEKNKMRQRDITREMIEITTGAESFK